LTEQALGLSAAVNEKLAELIKEKIGHAVRTDFHAEFVWEWDNGQWGFDFPVEPGHPFSERVDSLIEGLMGWAACQVQYQQVAKALLIEAGKWNPEPPSDLFPVSEP
jgi:hypothetical protein